MLLRLPTKTEIRYWRDYITQPTNGLVDRPPVLARLCLFSVVGLLVSFVIWAAFAQVEEIARGEGKVIPISKTQIIQASEPGVVQEIAVRTGQIVKRGDLIVRLDDTATTSTLGELDARARALRAQIARLDLEEKSDFDAPLVCPGAGGAAADTICANETRLFIARRDTFQNKFSVLRERLTQRQN